MIIDLNGVELLNQLCELAELTTRRAERRANAQTIFSDTGTRENLVDRDDIPSSLSELLSTITAILRQERYQPLLESKIEREFRAAVKEDATTHQPSGAEEISKDKPNSWSYFDPLCGELISFTPYSWVELTPERSKQIIEWARDYLRKTPPEKRRAAAGMSPWPIVR